MADPTPTEERLTADCTQLLTVSLADPAEFPFSDLFERIQEQGHESETVGLRWITAINRVRDAGRLTGGQADAMIELLAHVIVNGRALRDTPNAKPMTLEELPPGVSPFRSPEEQERHDAVVNDLLRSAGQDAIVQRIETEGIRFRHNALDALQELSVGEGGKENNWVVNYPSADGPLADPQPITGPRVDDSVIAERVEQWREATGGEGIWTVDAVLAFAVVAAYDNMEGEGDAWVASIQGARAEGIITRDLSWLLIERVTKMMVPEIPVGDTVLPEIRDIMEEIPYYPGTPATPDDDPRDRQRWETLDAVYEGRRERYRRRILTDAGEDEMVKMMEERPTEFQMRIATAATEWEVSD